MPVLANAYSAVRGALRDRKSLRKVAEADVILISFPKSGRTFVRTMLARLFELEHGLCERQLLKFSEMRKAGNDVPRLLFTHDGDAMRRPEQIRVSRANYAGKKVAMLVRHPADTMISRYHHLKYRSHDPARQLLAEQPLEQFLWTPKGGIPSIVEFLNQWAAIMRERGDIHLVRYEDVLSRADESLAELARFIGLRVTSDAIANATAFAKIENLRQREREGYFHSSRFGAGSSGHEQGYKVREGKSGGFRTKLPAAEVEKIEQYLADQLDLSYGY